MARFKNLLYEFSLISKSNYIPLLFSILLVMVIPNIFILSNLDMSKVNLRVEFSNIFTLFSSIALVNWNINFLQVWLFIESDEYCRTINKYFVFIRVLLIFIIYNVISLPTYLIAVNVEIMFLFDFIRFFILQFFVSSLIFLISILSKSINLTGAIVVSYIFINFIPTLREQNKLFLLSVYNVGTMDNVLNYYLYVLIFSLIIYFIASIYEKYFYRI